MGRAVRYDGTARPFPFVLDVLAEHLTLISICPEVAIGLGVPRETIHLDVGGDHTRLLGTSNRRDHTRLMLRYCRATAKALAQQKVCGFMAKKGSPSCGPYRVKLHRDGRVVKRSGRGLFADALARTIDWLPIEDEARLESHASRVQFVRRLFAYRRLQELRQHGASLKRMRDFHRRESLGLLLQDPTRLAALDNLMAGPRRHPRLLAVYAEIFMAAFARRPTHRNTVRALRTAFRTARDERPGHPPGRRVTSAIDRFAARQCPSNVPWSRLAAHTRDQDIPGLREQHLLFPEPLQEALLHRLEETTSPAARRLPNVPGRD